MHYEAYTLNNDIYCVRLSTVSLTTVTLAKLSNTYMLIPVSTFNEPQTPNTVHAFMVAITFKPWFDLCCRLLKLLKKHLLVY